VAVSSWISKEDGQEALLPMLARMREVQGARSISTVEEVGEVVAEIGRRQALAVCARLGVFTVLSQSLGDVLTQLENGLLPLARRQPGFCRAVIIKGAASTSAFICHAYASNAESEAAGAVIRPWVQENLSSVIVSLDRYHGDIVWCAR
jgi:hypothetical protein